MQSTFQKKFHSFDELKAHYVEPVGKSILTVSELDQKASTLLEILSLAAEAQTSEVYFDCCCKLINCVQDIEKKEMIRLFNSLNFTIRILSAIFNNPHFKIALLKIVSQEGSDLSKDLYQENISTKTYLNSAISLGFLGISLVVDTLHDNAILFLRKHLTSLVRIQIKNSDYSIDFARFCFSLETLIGINRYQYTKSPSRRFSVPFDGKKLFEGFKMAKSLAGVSFLSLTINATLSNHLKIASKEVEVPGFNLSKVLNNIYGAINRIEKGLSAYLDCESETSRKYVKDFFESFIKNNERNQLYIIGRICSSFQYQSEKSFPEVMLEKIQTAVQLKEGLTQFSKKNLKVFYGKIEESDIEWSNKLYVISMKTLSLLVELNSAQDDRWKISVAVYEFKEWIKGAHAILNKHSIEDEWGLIHEYTKQESSLVEWKSSFFTPVEKENLDQESLQKMSKSLFEKIVKTILGMLNTDGGVLLVGLVENPEVITRKEILDKLIVKNGKTFFDVGDELKTRKLTLDALCLKFYQELQKLTDTTPEKFNNLVYFEQVYLSDRDKNISVIKITVKKSENLFFCIEQDGGRIWASLVKRAERQTLDVDIRHYLSV